MSNKEKNQDNKKLQKIYKEVNSVLLQSRNVLITAHKKPDTDALGSVFSLAQYLNFLGKKYLIFLDQYDNFYNNLPFLNFFDVLKDKDHIPWKEIDLAVVLDSGDLERSGIVEKKENIPAHLNIVNIDHHISNNYFGKINLVESSASSTTEILAKFFKNIGFKISKEVATALLAGILADTDNFSNKGTSRESFDVAADLLKQGANINKINHHNRNNHQLDALKLWGKLFQRLGKNKKYGSVYTVITKEELKISQEKKLSDKVEDLVNFLNNLKDSRFSMVLKEYEDEIKVSLRTTKDNIDVSRLALFFGGGGHKKAAGFSIKGKLAKTKSGWKII